jgi:hypothetical protein
VEHVAVRHPGRPHQVEDVLHALQVHREALEAVGDLAEHRLARQRADLLEVGELRHFHAVEPHLPAEPPRAEGRRFPVVFHETDVVLGGIDPERAQGLEVQVLNVVGRGLEHHLVLVVVLQAVGVLAVPAVLRTARRLHVGRVPRLGADRAQERRGVERARAHLHVVGLEEHASAVTPERLEAEDEVLEILHDRPGRPCRQAPERPQFYRQARCAL